MDAVETDLPKVKKVKIPAKAEKTVKANGSKAPEKAAKSEKASTKKTEAKTAKPAKAEKAAKPAKAEAKAPKGKAAATKTAAKGKTTAVAKAPAKAKGGKNAPITTDSVAAQISKTVASGKAETVKVDYADSKSVVAGLVAKASTVLLRAYSDKNVSAVTHGDSDIAKAAKEVLAKNANAVRSAVVAKHSKKMAGSIVKAAKAADAGKLSAADYRAIAFEV